MYKIGLIFAMKVFMNVKKTSRLLKDSKIGLVYVTSV